MGKKHEQRTRAAILAKRAQPIMGFDKRPAPITAPVSRSKYTPHVGAKEQERAKRCYMSATFNASGDLRSAPVMHQVGGAPYQDYQEERYQDYESVF